MRERWALILKSGVIVVAMFFIIQGRPPAHGQERITPVDAMPETQAVQNALVNRDLATADVDRVAIHTEIADLHRVQNLQENEITALDTSWKAAMGFISFLQAGGMILSYRRKTT